MPCGSYGKRSQAHPLVLEPPVKAERALDDEAREERSLIRLDRFRERTVGEQFLEPHDVAADRRRIQPDFLVAPRANRVRAQAVP